MAVIMVVELERLEFGEQWFGCVLTEGERWVGQSAFPSTCAGGWPAGALAWHPDQAVLRDMVLKGHFSD